MSVEAESFQFGDAAFAFFAEVDKIMSRLDELDGKKESLPEVERAASAFVESVRAYLDGIVVH